MVEWFDFLGVKTRTLPTTYHIVPVVTHLYCLLFRIVHYEQRLKSLFYKKRFPERMGEVKPRVQGLFLKFMYAFALRNVFVSVDAHAH